MKIPESSSKEWAKSNKAQAASAWISSVALVIGLCFGLIGTYKLLVELESHRKNEVRESDRRIRDAYSRLYPMDMEIWKVIGQNPKLKAVLLDDPDGLKLNELSEDDRVRFDVASQMFGDMCEYYLLIKDDLKASPAASKSNCWEAYTAMIVTKSKGFREYIDAPEAEWSGVFKERFQKIKTENGL